jgi:hypothetical protein
MPDSVRTSLAAPAWTGPEAREGRSRVDTGHHRPPPISLAAHHSGAGSPCFIGGNEPMTRGRRPRPRLRPHAPAVKSGAGAPVGLCGPPKNCLYASRFIFCPRNAPTGHRRVLGTSKQAVNRAIGSPPAAVMFKLHRKFFSPASTCWRGGGRAPRGRDGCGATLRFAGKPRLAVRATCLPSLRGYCNVECHLPFVEEMDWLNEPERT